jgi:hypothetical protein
MSGRLHAPAVLLSEKAPGTRCIGGYLDPRAGLHYVEKWKSLTLPGLDLRPLCKNNHDHGAEFLEKIVYKRLSLYGPHYLGAARAQSVYCLQ